MLGPSLDPAVLSGKGPCFTSWQGGSRLKRFCEQGQGGDQEPPLSPPWGGGRQGLWGSGRGCGAAAVREKPSRSRVPGRGTRSLAESGGCCDDSLQQLLPSERRERRLHGLRGKAGTEGSAPLPGREVLGSRGPGLGCHCSMTGTFRQSHGKAGLVVWSDTSDIAVSGSRVSFNLCLGRTCPLIPINLLHVTILQRSQSPG